jgi:protein-S-isoprenylcysteine O-methyltransferase Ste14
MPSVFLSMLLCLVLVAPFQWFTVAGAKTFKRGKMRDAGATLGQLSFLSGTMVILWTGLRYLHHPFYGTYLLAFVGMIVATPTVIAFVFFALNVVLLVHMALDDERTLARSPLAAAYDAYKARTGTFLLLPRRGRLDTYS